MEHNFNVDVATQYGLVEAILLNNIYFWVEHNKANCTHFYDGEYWTYNSIKAFLTLFPYLTNKKIRNALDHLEEENIIKSGNYNKSPYDRTKWYTITKKGYSILPKGQMNLSEKANENSQKGEPIPDIKPYTKPDKKRESRRFAPPSIEDVRAYCIERGNNVNPQRFIDHYESNGWMVGRSKMKDWRAAVRTWESNGIGKQQPKKKPEKRPAKNVEEIMACWGLDREVAKMAFDRKDDTFSYVKEG